MNNCNKMLFYKSLTWDHTVREWQRSGFEPTSFCAILPEGCGRPAPALSACLELPLPSSIPVGAPSPTLSPKLHPAGLWGPTLTHNVFLLGISIFITWGPLSKELTLFLFLCTGAGLTALSDKGLNYLLPDQYVFSH